MGHRFGQTRRGFLGGVMGLGAAHLAGAELQERARRPKVAAIITEFTPRSHAHVILENFLKPYLFRGAVTEPGVEVASMYIDQFPARDMSRQVSKDFGVPIFPTIAQALTLGGETLAVDAVLSIGEHGDYPVNAKGQREYPRKRFFDEIVAVFRRSGRVAPVFSDKHLSYRWDWAKEMYDTARELRIPLMAGSSVPLAERRPPLEIPAGSVFQAAVSIHGGPVESYDFHGLEVLSSMVESRKGGETGVSQVEFLSGAALWEAGERGVWSLELADAALAAELGPDTPTLRKLLERPAFAAPPHGLLVTFVDGWRALVLKVGSSATRWNFAARLAGRTEPLATAFYVGPWQNRNLFKALSQAIQTHFRERRAPYPVERTLLVTGVLDAAMDSRQQGRPIDTPHLAIAYQPRDFRAMRENGASWKIITEETPEPPGIQR